MTSTLIAMYEQNEQYHSAKETMFWLSTTLYLAFSAYALNWVLTAKLRDNEFMYVVGVALTIVAIFAAKFSIRQNWLKCLSVVKSEGYEKLMVEAPHDEAIRKGLRELAVTIAEIESRTRAENRTIWRDKGKPGVWIMWLLWLFYSVQMVAVLYRLFIY